MEPSSFDQGRKTLQKIMSVDFKEKAHAIAVLYFVTTGFLFGYFALGVTKDPLACFAKNDSNDIWKAGEKTNFIEVG